MAVDGDDTGSGSGGPLKVLTTVFQQITGIAVIAAMAVAFSISFAALVYAGPLAADLGRGIGLTLLGGVILAVLGIASYSARGAVAHPQDITAVLLGGAALTIAARLGEGAFPTVAAMVAVATALAGVTAYLAGTLRLGSMVRYIPYPVIAGFLAATGYLLVLGGIGIALGRNVTIHTLVPVLDAGLPAAWAPWLAGGLALSLASRRIASDLLLPTALLSAAAAFYATLAAAGLTLEDARALGLFLGPFDQGGFLSTLDPGLVAEIRWAEVIRSLPTLVAVAGLVILGALLNVTGVEMTLGDEADAERDMRATGAGNVLAALVGSIPGYIALGETIIARRMGLRGAVPGLAAAGGCLLTFLFGATVLSNVPAGLLAMVVAYLGFDLLITWVWEARARMSAREYAAVLIIVAAAALVGFLPALALGTLAAAAIFVMSYARTEVVRMRSTAATRRSRVERSDEAQAILRTDGAETVILELEGYVFFGTAHRLYRRAVAEIEAGADCLIVDFGRVSGVDASAAQSLGRIAAAGPRAGVRIVFSGLPEAAARLGAGAPERAASLDAALEAAEARILARAGYRGGEQGARLMQAVSDLETAFAGQGGIVRRVDLGPGDALLARGAASDEAYVLVSGALRAEIELDGGARLRVAAFLPCALVGELAYYAGVERTAWVVAEEASTLVRVDLKALEGSAHASVTAFHRAAARSMARRVMRMTDLLREAGV